MVFSAETNSTLFDLPNPISPAAAFLNGRNSLPSDGAFLEAVCRLCGNRALKNRKKFIGKDTPKKLLFTQYCFIILTVLATNTICVLKNTAEPGGPSVMWQSMTEAFRIPIVPANGNSRREEPLPAVRSSVTTMPTLLHTRSSTFRPFPGVQSAGRFLTRRK